LAFSWISALRLLYCPDRYPLTPVSEKPEPPLCRGLGLCVFFWILISMTGAIVLTACGGGGGGGGAPAPAATYSLSASVSGLSGTGLSLELNKAAAVAVAANGAITLGTGLAAGATYQVTVAGSPVNPMQTCTVASPSGSIEAASVTLSVSCTTDPVQTAISTGLDSALPQATVNMVAKVMTVGGSGALGSWVPRGTPNASGETLLLGVDANGHIVTAAITAANDGTMSATSTALVFVRMFIAEESTPLTATEMNTQIQASANFAPLVQAINADLMTQKLPLSDPSIVAMVATLANATVAAIPAAAGSRAHVKAAVPVGPWQSGTSFTIIAGGPTYITSSGSPTGQLVNKLAIPWSVSESQGTASLLGSQIVPGGGTLAVPISNSPFNLTLEQTGTTLGMIANDFSFGLYQGFSTIATAALNATNNMKIPACLTSFSDALTSLAQKVANQTTNPDLLFTNMIDQIDKPFVVGLIAGCAPTIATQAGNIAALYTTYEQGWLDVTAAIGRGSGIPLLAVPALNFVKEIDAANIYADNTYDLEICANVNYTISSCVASLVISGSTTKQYLAPGATITRTIQGYAASGASTVLPAALQVTFDQTVLSARQANGVLSITALEPAAGAALPGSSVSVTVTEPVSGATASVPVWIVWPILQPPQRIYSVGPDPTPVAIQLIDPNGNPIAVPSGITYDKTTAAATQFVLDNSSGGTSNWTIPADASPLGNFNVIATDPAGNDYPTLALTLEGVTSGTCEPPAGATTCAVTLYSIPDGSHSGFVAPAPGTITTVQTSNGVTTTSVNNLSPLGVTIYDNVNGPPLNAPICNYEPAVGCPTLTPHNFQLCGVDGKYTPVSYSSVVSDQVPILANSGCSGSPNVNNINTGYTLNAGGILKGSDTSTATENEVCAGVTFGLAYKTTTVIQNAKNDPISMDLKDGSGSASVSESRQTTVISTIANENLSETTTVTGTQSWPAESVFPPQFPNTGITAITTQVPAGQALPQACTAGTP
jgi:hypothetical protein